MTLRILVLGSGGFLGRHVLGAIDGDPRVEPVAHVRPADGRSDERALPLDLATASSDDLGRLIDTAGADAVINCAGRTTGDDSAMRPVNVVMVHNLLLALSERPSVRLVHLGSAAEYGPSQPGVALPESAAAVPASPYGVTKLEASLLVQAAAAEGRVAGVVLRVFNPVGAGMPGTSLPGRLAAQLREAELSGTRTVRVAPLSARRDFIDARDVATAALAAATHPAAPGGIFNAGRGEAVSCRDLAAMLVRASGQTITVTEDEEPPGRSSAVSWQQADITRITTRLVWSPRYSIEDAVERLWMDVTATPTRVPA